MECSTISPTCPTCAKYQGRIYSISGKTPGYPSLYETAFKHGYSVIHPNCRHQFFPYKPKFHTAEERAALEENTRRPFEEDTQSERAREEYAHTQMQMRQWNKELNEFAEMQRFYKERGEQAPYQTLGSFRRAYRSEEGSLAYGKSYFERRDERQMKSFQTVLGKENVPKTLAEFQEMKYNTDRSSFDLLSREKQTIGKIESKDWTSTFKQKAKETYYEFRQSGIELTDHGVARFLSRNFDIKQIISICNKPYNYVQINDGKRIKFYDKVAVIYAKDTEEIVSVIRKNKIKEEWKDV